jgi:hypothetical protein
MGKAIGWTGYSRNVKFNLDVDAVGFLCQGLGWETDTRSGHNACVSRDIQDPRYCLLED